MPVLGEGCGFWGGSCHFLNNRVFLDMEVLLLVGAFMVGLPIIIMGCIAAWRERQYKEQEQ
jgi:hypothetical protein